MQFKKFIVVFVFILSGILFSSIPNAKADTTGEASYNLKLTSYYELLDHINEPDWTHYACWQVVTQYDANQAAPAVRLTNTSAAGGPSLTQFEIDLTGRPGVIDYADFSIVPAGVTVFVSPPLGAISDNITASHITVTFGGRPLAPGESIQGHLYLKATTAPTPLKYGSVFWDEFGSNRNDNATVTTTFDYGQYVLLSRFFEFPRANADFPEDAILTSGSSRFVDCGGMKAGVDYHNWQSYNHRKRKVTATNTPTNTNTPYYTNTPTNTPTNTNTPYYTNTPSSTPTKTNTPYYTNTPSSTPTKTNTPYYTNTPSSTPTSTNTPFYTNTPSSTPTKTNTPFYTNTPSSTPTKTNTPYYTSTNTNTPNYTNTPSATPTSTVTKTNTPYYTNTPSPTPTKTSTPYITYTPTSTPTKTGTPYSNVSQIYPEMNCKTLNGDGTTTYYLGYLNNNPNDVTIVAGTDSAANKNILTVDNIVVNVQPSTFKPGRFKGESSFIVGSSAVVRWVLQYALQAPVEVNSTNFVPDCQPLLPIVECIENLSPTSKLARVGYDNKNDFKISIPMGTYNRFNPLPQDRGQPVTFFSGRIVNLFTTTFNGSLDWILGPNKATATDTSPLCNPNSQPICDIGPQGSVFIGVSCKGSITNVDLDGSNSSDPDGSPLTYLWSTDCGGTLLNPTSAKATLQLTAPGAGQAVSCSAILTVNDGISGKTCQKPISVTACINDCSQPDICGVCGGNGTSCLDCKGVANGGAKRDQCGVCNGNNTCLDCAGIPNGSSKLDNCGVCNGTNACQGCLDTNIKDKQFEIDNRAKQILEVANKFAKALAKTKNPAAVKLSIQIAKEAKEAYKQVWSAIWSISSVIKSCTNSSSCTQSDNSVSINNINTTTANLLRIIDKASKKLNKLVGIKPGNTKLLGTAKDLSTQNSTEVKSLPRFNSVCG
jgi:hypothetical protein